jgi:hypothetical protein
MPTSNIEPSSWMTELDSFSRQHEGWIVTVASRTPQGAISVEARDVRLQGVTQAAPNTERVVIDVGDGEDHLLHEVDVKRMTMDSAADRAVRSLTLEGKDGTVTTVTFRSPMRPEDVDGLPAR